MSDLYRCQQSCFSNIVNFQLWFFTQSTFDTLRLKCFLVETNFPIHFKFISYLLKSWFNCCNCQMISCFQLLRQNKKLRTCSSGWVACDVWLNVDAIINYSCTLWSTAPFIWWYEGGTEQKGAGGDPVGGAGKHKAILNFEFSKWKSVRFAGSLQTSWQHTHLHPASAQERNRSRQVDMIVAAARWGGCHHGHIIHHIHPLIQQGNKERERQWARETVWDGWRDNYRL